MTLRSASAGQYSGRTDKPGTSFTVMAWFRLNSAKANGVMMEVYNDSSGVGDAYVYRIGLNSAGNKLYVRKIVAGDATVYEATGTTTLSTGVWYHVAFTSTGNVVWLNGSSEASISQGSSSSGGTSYTRFGSNGTTSSDCDFANIKVWNTSISSGDVAAEVYAASYVRTSNIWAWVPMLVGGDQGDSQSAGTDRNFTLTGSPSTVDAYPPVFITDSRTVPLSGALSIAGLTRTITLTSALKITLTRTVPFTSTLGILAAPTLIDPDDDAEESNPVTFVWQGGETGYQGQLHYRLIAATSPADVLADGQLEKPFLLEVSTDVDVGFEYDTSGAMNGSGPWDDYPSGGLDPADHPRHVRYVDDTLDNVTIDWTVRKELHET